MRWARAARPAALLTALLSVLSAAPGAAATPSTGAIATTLARGTTEQGMTTTVKTLTIAPGGTTGWHRHPGQVVAVVRSGTLTRLDARCWPHRYPAGQAVIEPGGDLHAGLNHDRVPLVLVVTYLSPPQRPDVIDAPAPACSKNVTPTV